MCIESTATTKHFLATFAHFGTHESASCFTKTLLGSFVD